MAQILDIASWLLLSLGGIFVFIGCPMRNGLRLAEGW